MNEASVKQTVESQIRMQCLEIAARHLHRSTFGEIISEAQKMYDFVSGDAPKESAAA